MNYIKEINAFYNHLEFKPLSASAINLWYALMHMNNKTMWANTFTVANRVLQMKSQLPESTLKRARSELHKKGYIVYLPGKKGEAPSYQMISLCYDVRTETGASCMAESVTDSDQDLAMTAAREKNKDETFVTNVHEQSKSDDMKQEPQVTLHQQTKDFGMEKRRSTLPSSVENVQSCEDDQSQFTDPFVSMKPDNGGSMDPMVSQPLNPSMSQPVASLYKPYINKIKPYKNVVVATTAQQFYRDNIGEMKPFIHHEILYWTEQLGDELVIHALTKALERSITDWAYVKFILKAWKNKGIRTLQDAWLEEATFRKTKSWKLRQTRHHSANIPDWFNERKQTRIKNEIKKQQDLKDFAEKISNPLVAQKEMEELDQLLKSVINAEMT